MTTSILPVVEQYGQHSRAVWEASKVPRLAPAHYRPRKLTNWQFWKHFFEASANVSLSGYEELAHDEEDDDSSAVRDDSTADYTARHHDDATGAEHSTLHGQDDSLLDDGEVTGSTPRPPATKTIQAQLSHLESPYEAMRREMKQEETGATRLDDAADDDDDDEQDSTILFAQRTARLPDMSMTPRGSLEHQDSGKSVQRHQDPLLHRVLDRTYRLQATPHKPAYRISPLKKAGDDKMKETAGPLHDSPMSSPEMAVPTLRSEAFMSPYKSNARQRLAAATRGPRTPGVSVQTPATAKKSRDAFAAQGEGATEGRQRYEIDWESDGEGDDGDLYAGMSPPQTIQFALPPSKLLQTPGECAYVTARARHGRLMRATAWAAREASKRIIDDILIDAGADPASSEYSPTMVKMNEDILNDSF